MKKEITNKIEATTIKLVKEETDKEIRNDSRKYKLALLIFAAATIMCLIPPVLAVFAFKTTALIILSGEAWVTVMSMLGGLYFGANILQKKFSQDNAVQEHMAQNETVKDEQNAEYQGDKLENEKEM